MTDEEFTSERWRCVRHKKKLRVTGATCEFELFIQEAEVVVRGNHEFISFVVPQIADPGVQDFILGGTVEVG